MLLVAGGATQAVVAPRGRARDAGPLGGLLRRARARAVRHPRHVQRPSALAPARRDPLDRVDHRGRDDGRDLGSRRDRERPPHGRADRADLDPCRCCAFGGPHGPLHRPRPRDRARRGRPPDADRRRRPGRPAGRQAPDGPPRVRPAAGRASSTTTRSSSTARRSTCRCSAQAGTSSA